MMQKFNLKELQRQKFQKWVNYVSYLHNIGKDPNMLK